MKRITILGSTGSIGTSTLDIVKNQKDKVTVTGLSTRSNINLLRDQIKEFKPAAISVWEDEKAKELQADIHIPVFHGIDGLIKLVKDTDSNLIVSSLVGGIGLEPTLEAIKCGKDIALANKEVLVMAGDLVMSEAQKYGVTIIPVDSEHSALAQCLYERSPEEVHKIIITASGGPFYNKGDLDLVTVSPQEALNHPRWTMGRKVTIDSSTLMNKGFEVIEASHLFNIPVDKIDVVIHPESIIHSMVEFVDGSVIAHMHVPDMRVPIQYALSWPVRWNKNYGILDFAAIKSLNFREPDHARFPALELAYEAARRGGTAPTVLNACDEVCVDEFMAGHIRFTDIVEVIKKVMEKHTIAVNPDLDMILGVDKWAREETKIECDRIRSL